MRVILIYMTTMLTWKSKYLHCFLYLRKLYRRQRKGESPKRLCEVGLPLEPIWCGNNLKIFSFCCFASCLSRALNISSWYIIIFNTACSMGSLRHLKIFYVCRRITVILFFQDVLTFSLIYILEALSSLRPRTLLTCSLVNVMLKMF